MCRLAAPSDLLIEKDRGRVSVSLTIFLFAKEAVADPLGFPVQRESLFSQDYSSCRVSPKHVISYTSSARGRMGDGNDSLERDDGG